MDLAREAYEAYAGQTKWKSLVSGAPLPQWPDLSAEIQSAWRVSAGWVAGRVLRQKAAEVAVGRPAEICRAGQWHKLMAIIMRKHGMDHEVITVPDVEACIEGGINIVAEEIGEELHVRIVDEATADELEKEVVGGVVDGSVDFD